jgi:hypothetical protein
MEGKWPQQQSIRHSENGSICADAQGERQDGRDSETGALAEQARAKTKIAKQRLHGEENYRRAKTESADSSWPYSGYRVTPPRSLNEC